MQEEPKCTIVYKGQEMGLEEAGRLLLKEMIEKELPAIEEYTPGADPYIWLGNHLSLRSEVVKGWVYPPVKDEAESPPIDLFFYLIYLTKSEAAIQFFYELIGEESGMTEEELRDLIDSSKGYAGSNDLPDEKD